MADDFDKGWVCVLARLADAAYEAGGTSGTLPWAAARCGIVDWRIKPRDFQFPDDGVYGFFAVDRLDNAFLCLSGTRGLDLTQWRTNLDVDESTLEGVDGHVSEGLTEAWGAARDAILEELVVPGIQRCGGIKRLFVVGHSLGGALAIVSGVDIAANGVGAKDVPVPTVHVCAFAAPRVGDAEFAQATEGLTRLHSIFHVQNLRDPVPRLPSSIDGDDEGRFVQPGTPVYMQGQTKTYAIGGLPPIDNDYHRLLHDMYTLDWDDIFKEHSIDRYIELLNLVKEGSLVAPAEPRWHKLLKYVPKSPGPCVIV